MNDGCLDEVLAGIEVGIGIADDRAVGRVAPAVDPGFEYAVRLEIVVILEIVQNEEVGSGEFPNLALPRAGRVEVVDLIDPPVVRRVPGKLPGIVAFGTECEGTFVLG